MPGLALGGDSNSTPFVLEDSRDAPTEPLRDPRPARQDVRYDVSRPCLGFPVAENGQVDPERILVGVVMNASQEGIAIVCDIAPPEWLRYLLLGIDFDSSLPKFCPVEIQRVEMQENGLIRWGCRRGGPLVNLFRQAEWLPRLNCDRWQYQLPLDPAVWLSLEAMGGVERQVLDRVAVCSSCRAVVTTRWGCGHCLSAFVTPTRMIHHYACAHVDLVEKFCGDNRIQCPKCQAQHILVGADFEYLEGPLVCQECGQSALDRTPVAHCLGCGTRSLLAETETQEIIAYQVRGFTPWELRHDG